MNIIFTREQLLNLLDESLTFRRIYLDLTCDSLNEWRKKIKSKFPNFMSGEKIPAIKWIREQVNGNKELIEPFEKAGFETYKNGLGLASAKKFVESCEK